MYFVGFDIGGSSVKAVLVENKQIIKSQIEDLPDNLDGLLNLLKKIFEEVKAGVGEISGVGVSLAGAIDAEREYVLGSPNIAFLNNQPLRSLIAKELGCDVKIEHDVHCFLIADREVGLAKGLKNVFYFAVGTGVGCAFVIDGVMARGVNGAAGEGGHMIIDSVNGKSLEHLSANMFLREKLGVDGFEAEEMARKGDVKAVEVFEERAENLGTGIANVINILDPGLIIIAGGIVSAKDLILPNIEKMVKKYVNSSRAKETKILFSELGRFGGALGAALGAAKN